ncbi:MAG: dTMP kinase [Alphaproteobacteria bacterium]
MTARGRFITLEGGEGAGKSTQLRRLAEWLESQGQPVLQTREPGGSPGAEDIRRLLVEGEPDRWLPWSETLLFFAARFDHVARTMRPALAAGRWVLCDRFADSTVAYQGAAGGISFGRLTELYWLVLGDFEPDLTIVLDLPVEVGMARARSRDGVAPARFERKDRAFHARVRDGFATIVTLNPQRCVMVDADADVDTVAARIRAVVAERLGLPGGHA